MSLLNSNRLQGLRYWTKDAGSRSAVAGSIQWVGRFIAIATTGTDTEHLSNGYISLNPLPIGTVVTVQAAVGAAASSRTVTATGLQLNTWEALMYQITPGDGQASVNTKFYITSAFGNYFHSNEMTVMVCHRGSDKLLWLDGIYTDLNGNLVELPAGNDFFRTIAGTLLPDGTTDTDEDIRRIRDIGLGGVITETIPTIVGAPTQANFHLSNNVANLGQILRGASPVNYYLQRTLPNVVNNTIEIGRMTAGSGSFSHIIGIAVSDGGFATAKTFVMAWNYSQGNFVVTPTADGGAYGVNDYELIAKNGAGFVDYLLRRKSGATAGVAQITICSLTGSDEVFQEKSATGTDATVYNESNPTADFWRSGAGATTLPNGTTDLTEDIRRNGMVGLNIDPVQTLDVNGGGYFGTIVSLAIRNASLVAGILNAAGTASMGPAATAGQAVLNMFVEGVAGAAFNNVAQFRIGRLTTGVGANTILETWLSVGNTNSTNTQSVGFHALANTGGLRLIINSTSANQTGGAIGVNATGDVVKIASVGKFRVVRNLVVGANVITDNLGLITPFARTVQVRNNTTGAEIAVNVTAETANTFTITTGAAVTGARITSIG